MSLYVDIEKALGGFHLSASFEAGDGVLALVGPSGCGKSVLLKCIAGLMTPDCGKIVLNGNTLFDSFGRTNVPPRRRHVGYLFQQYALFPNMSVEQNISAACRRRDEGAVPEYIRLFRLEGLEKHRPVQLSGGQQQRVALARVMASEPDVLLLDEPFSALDPDLKYYIERETGQAVKRFGKTVILVSHDRGEAYRMSDRIATMESGIVGRILEKGQWIEASGSVVFETGAIPQNVIVVSHNGETCHCVPEEGK